MILGLILPLLDLVLVQCQLLSSTDGAGSIVAPQVVILSMWRPEAQVWHRRFNESKLGNLTAVSTAIPGLSMLFPSIFCTETGLVCQLTLGEGEINAAASMMALILSNRFDFRQTYFLFAGIAGANPHHATIGSVAIARYAVQVALQYEIDPRSLPQDWPTGYISYGRDYPLQYPSVIYGTEVFEVNDNLRQAAFALASKSRLSDQNGPREYRSKYSGGGYQDAVATRAPSVVKCDIATSDVYYSGTKLAVAFENTTELWTNGSGIYCMSAQEENATLEVMVRAAIEGMVDFARIILLRSGQSSNIHNHFRVLVSLGEPSVSGWMLNATVGSNFDRPPPGLSDWEHLRRTDQNGFLLSIENLYNAGIEIVRGIVSDWKCTYQRGIEPKNYVGDIFGSLGGDPDFGFGSITAGKKVKSRGQDADLAFLEMERRGRFGLRAVLK